MYFRSSRNADDVRREALFALETVARTLRLDPIAAALGIDVRSISTMLHTRTLSGPVSRGVAQHLYREAETLRNAATILARVE